MIPPLLPLADQTDVAWQRKVRDAVNGALRRLMSLGATGERPANPVVGTLHFDTSLNIPVWFDGSNWRNAAGVIA